MSDQDTRDKRRQKRDRKTAGQSRWNPGVRQAKKEEYAEETQYDSHMSDDLFHDPCEHFEELNFHDYDDELRYRRQYGEDE